MKQDIGELGELQRTPQSSLQRKLGFCETKPFIIDELTKLFDTYGGLEKMIKEAMNLNPSWVDYGVARTIIISWGVEVIKDDRSCLWHSPPRSK